MNILELLLVLYKNKIKSLCDKYMLRMQNQFQHLLFIAGIALCMAGNVLEIWINKS